MIRSSRSEELHKIGVLKFTGKNLCRSLFFNKVTCPTPATLSKQAPTHVFSCKFSKIFKKAFSFLQNTSGRLLLYNYLTKLTYSLHEDQFLVPLFNTVRSKEKKAGLSWINTYTTGIYLLKVNNENNRKMPMTSLRHSGIFIVNFEQNLHFVQVFPLLVLNKCRLDKCLHYCCV